MKPLIWSICTLIISMMVLAAPPIIENIDTWQVIEGMTNTLQVRASDPDAGILTYRMVDFQNEQNLSIDPSTGVLSYTPALASPSLRNVVIAVVDENDETTLATFDIQVNPVLAFVNNRAGNQFDLLLPLDSDGRTISFKPGDVVFFSVEVQNLFTNNNYPLFLQQDVRPILENVLFAIESDGVVFNEPINLNDQLLALEPQETTFYTFHYEIPFDAPEGEYNLLFKLNANDQDAPTSDYSNTQAVTVPIVKSTHDAKIISTLINRELNTEFDCAQKQDLDLAIRVANIGRSPEDYRVTIIPDNQNAIERRIQLAIGQEGTVNVPLDLSDISGDSIVTINVARTADPRRSLAASELTLSLGNCEGLTIEESIPNQNTIIIDDEDEQEFSVNLNNPSNVPVTYKWILDFGAEEADLGDEPNIVLAGNSFVPGEYTLTVVVNENSDTEVSRTWTVHLIDRPLGFEEFSGPSTTDIEDENNIENVALVIENEFGKIEYNENVDLSALIDISEVITITASAVSVDSENAPELNEPSTITLNRGYANPIILKSAEFNNGPFNICNDCRIVSSTAASITFIVNGFSTYRVDEAGVQGIQISPITIADARRNENATAIVTITNTGDAPLTNVASQFENVAAAFHTTITQALPREIPARGQAELHFRISIPANEPENSHTIGTLRITSTETASSVPIVVDPKSFLTIESIKINSKTSGDLQPGEKNKIEIKVRNDYTEDMENVVVTVRILDVDNDDLEEESDEFDLDSGDDDKVTLTFDLSGENLDEEDYILEVQVEADAKDDTQHQSEQSKSINVERQRHDLIITRASLLSSNLQCTRETMLQVDVENQGRSDEDDVEIRARSAGLALDERRSGIDLDDFAGSDNDYSVSIPIEAENAAPGTYPITIEVLRDGDIEETQTVNLAVSACTRTNTGSQGNNVYGNDNAAADALKAKLARDLAEKQTAQKISTVTATFRDSSLYIPFLGALAFLVLIAIILAIAVGMKGKNRRNRGNKIKE